MTRSFGDKVLKRFVIAEPEVATIQIMPGTSPLLAYRLRCRRFLKIVSHLAGDELLILASDGLHEVIDGDEMFRIVQEQLHMVRLQETVTIEQDNKKAQLSLHNLKML